MSFKDTGIWRGAFVDARADATQEEQTRLATAYEAMRERAAALVAKISADLPHMTIHNVTHLDALWEMASLACGIQVDLNPAEAFVFGGAVLLHDAAMTLAAYPGGLDDLKQTVEWKDIHARLQGAAGAESGDAATEIERRATDDALRLLHAKQAENLPKIAWTGPQGDAMYLIEDAQIRNFYGSKIGKIAYSHWWSISRVDDELAGNLGPLAGVTNNQVDLLKVACLLRVADAMHLDQRRAPAFEYALTQPTGVSADHWKFQERMAKPFVKGEALVYTAQPPFEVDLSEAWWTAFDALQMVDRELRGVDRVMRDRGKTPFVVRRIEGAHSPSELAKTVETVGWTPVDSTLRVSDVPKIVATLGGAKLYGDDLSAPVRELIQNSLDAINARRHLEGRSDDWGEIKIGIEARGDDHWLTIEDNGVGMSETVLTGPLIDFGNSFWRSSLAIQELPGLASSGMKPRGRYGIGFFSVFMLGDYVRVTTRRFNRETGSAKVLEFRNGLGSRPHLKDAATGDAPIDGGTRIEVKLRDDPVKPKGLLFVSGFGKGHSQPFDALVAVTAPATDVTITMWQQGALIGTLLARDWLTIDDSTLVQRIGRPTDIFGQPSAAVELMELKGEDGRIYGRACIDPGRYWSKNGLVTVDGLAADTMSHICGILVGAETTASRNSAVPIVPPEVFAAWASAQAIAIAASDLSDSAKADAAEIVAALGGDIGDLPILFLGGEWINGHEFSALVRERNSVALHFGEVNHEEDDDVTKREFEEWFELDEDVGQVGGSRTSTLRGKEVLRALSGGKGVSLRQLVEHILFAEWGTGTFSQQGVAVGSVNGTDVIRGALTYSRGSGEEHDEEDVEATPLGEDPLSDLDGDVPF